MDLERQRTDIDGLTTRVHRVEGSITDLTRRMDLIQQADNFLGEAQKVRDAYLNERFGSLEKKIDGYATDMKSSQDKQRTFINSIALIAITSAFSIAVAIITFFVKGGFNAAG